MAHLVLGADGAYSPPAGLNVHLVLGGSAGPGGTTHDLTAAVSLRLTAAVSGRVMAPAGKRATALPWGRATKAAAAVEAPWDSPGSAITAVRLPRSRYGAAGAASLLPWGRAADAAREAAAPWGRAEHRGRNTRLPWGRAEHRGRNTRLPWGRAEHKGLATVLPWGRAGAAMWLHLPPPPDTPAPPYVLRRVRLRLCTPIAAVTTMLRLGIDPCTGAALATGPTAITPRRSYVQQHILSAFRLPDMLPLAFDQFSIGASADAYGWTLNASGPASLLSDLSPVAGLPARVRVTIDGLQWEFVVEGLRRDRSFNRTSATITGRSASALLAAPYMPERTWTNAFDMTAEQIAADVLAFTGVGLNWGVTDWNVPAGAWSFAGPPLAAVIKVAASAGAIVQSPRVGEALSVQARYPVPPWEWAGETPDVTLALDPVMVEGYERADRPAYDGVYILGAASGVSTLVKRTGSMPAMLKPMITDPLITHVDAARQRGIAELAPSGPVAVMTLTLPVLTGPSEPGVIDVGKLILVDDPAGAWRALVTAVAVRANWPSVLQTLTVERHL